MGTSVKSNGSCRRTCIEHSGRPRHSSGSGGFTWLHSLSGYCAHTPSFPGGFQCYLLSAQRHPSTLPVHLCTRRKIRLCCVRDCTRHKGKKVYALSLLLGWSFCAGLSQGTRQVDAGTCHAIESKCAIVKKHQLSKQ